MKRLLTTLVLVCLGSYCFGQNVFQIFKENVGLLKYSYQDTLGTQTIIGTGTIICKSLNSRGDSALCFIVTNKHVLPDFNKSKNIEFSISSPDSSKNQFIKITIPIYQDNGKYDAHVSVSKDEDLSIIEFSRAFERSGLNSKKHHFIGMDFLASKNDIKVRNIGIGDMVFFQGYPSFFYDESNISPVFRTGFLATDPSQSYHFNQFLKRYFNRNILNGFLIDGNVFGGSSGSLVCLYPTLINQSSQFHPELSTTKSQAWILGILTESYYDIGTKEAYSQRVNIGGVISSEKIIELINNYKLQ